MQINYGVRHMFIIAVLKLDFKFPIVQMSVYIKFRTEYHELLFNRSF